MSSTNAMSSSSSSRRRPPFLRRTDILKLLEIAESAAKMVPVLEGILEGGFEALRKILELVNSMRICKSVCISLAERAALYVSSVCIELARMPEGQHLHIHDNIVNLVDCLLEIEQYMTSLSRPSSLRRVATSSAIQTEIAAFKDKLDDAVSIFQIHFAINLERMLGHTTQNICNDIALSTDMVIRASSVQHKALLDVLAAIEQNVVAAIQKPEKTAQGQPAFSPTTAFDDPITIIDHFLFIPQYMLLRRPGASTDSDPWNL